MFAVEGINPVFLSDNVHILVSEQSVCLFACNLKYNFILGIRTVDISGTGTMLPGYVHLNVANL
jgi:hypothetical protein